MDKYEAKGKYKNINRLLDIIGSTLILLIVTTFMYWGKAIWI